MTLKRIIQHSKLVKAGKKDPCEAELELPGEPMLYSPKYNLANYRRTVQYYRNQQFHSILRTFFRPQHHNIPVVIFVRFYITPPEREELTKAQLRSEKVPARYTPELCEYLLSFMEMLHHVIISSYRQVVKIDVEKWYSDKPKTVMKFMRHSQHENVKHRNPIHAKAQGQCPSCQGKSLQPKRVRNEKGKGLRDQNLCAGDIDRPTVRACKILPTPT